MKKSISLRAFALAVVAALALAACGKPGDQTADPSITVSVKSALAADPNLSAIKIDVDTKDGVVTLKGPAPDQAAVTRATELAGKSKGVKSVNNQLRVQAKP